MQFSGAVNHQAPRCESESCSERQCLGPMGMKQFGIDEILTEMLSN